MLTNFLLCVPAGQEIDRAREETSLDATKKEASSEKALVALGLRQRENNTAPDPDYSRQVYRRSAFVHDHIGRNLAEEITDKEQVYEEGVICDIG